MDPATDFIFAFGIGVLTGVGELVGRYRDEPAQALLSRPAYLYVAINGAASFAALFLARTFGWTFGMEAGTDQARVTQVLVAGFGAMALFRSSLFIYRHDGEDIGIGPVAFLQVMLDATDRAVDRRRAKARDQSVSRIMKDLTFADIDVALPTYAGNVMQNFSMEDQARLGNQVKALRDTTDLSDRMKVLELGVVVMNVLGEDVLEALVNTIKRELRQAAGSPAEEHAPGGLSAVLQKIRRQDGANPASEKPAAEHADPPASQAAPQKEPPKEPAPKEPAPKEPAPKEPAPKEPAPKEPAPKEPAPKEPPPKEPPPES